MNDKPGKNNVKPTSSPAKKLLIASVLLITVAIAQYLIFDFIGLEARQDLRMVDTEIGVSYGFDAHATFYSPGGRNFFFAARDGIQNISSTGDLRWHHGFSMSQPIMVGRGSMVAVGERNNSRSIYVFGPAGYLYNVDLPYPALYFTVNGTGYLSVIMVTDIGYVVQVFNPADPHNPDYGFWAPIVDANVFPWSVDVSECGTYIAMALVDVETLIFSRLTFSYIRRADSRGTQDGLFSSYRFDDEFIVRVRFTSCGRVIVVTDQQIVGFMAGEGHQNPLWRIPLHNRLDKFIISDNHFAFVTGDPVLNQPESDTFGVLRIYDFNGRQTGSYDLGRRVTHLSFAHNTVLAGTDRTFYAINVNGIRLWTHLAIHDVREVIFLDNTDTILLAGSTNASVWRRLRVA